MVKVGFIVEGDSDEFLINSTGFRNLLTRFGLVIYRPGLRMSVEGISNLELGKEEIDKHINELNDADLVFVLVDLENAPCITIRKDKIAQPRIHTICVAVKGLEAWLLADHQAMASWLGMSPDEFYEETPESTPATPLERIKEIARTHNKRGPGPSKPKFWNAMINKHGFSLERAAAHPHCPSARYFLNKLKEAASRMEDTA